MSAGKVTLICVAGLTFNLIGSLVASLFNLPVYLDTSGTIFIAALGGYIPGIAVGFFTNLTKSFVIPSEMYFCSINVAVAIFTTYFARKGYFHSLDKILLLIPALAFLTGLGDMLLENFLKASEILEPVVEYDTDFTVNFPRELLDKAFSIFMAFLLLKFIPPHVKKSFRTIGQKQAPLPDEMKRVAAERNYLSSSLRTKMLAILMMSSLLLSFSISLISYLLFRETALHDRIKTVESMTVVALSEINPHRVDNYLEQGRYAEGYMETEEKLYAIKNSAPDAKYLYVYRIMEDGCHVIFDLDTASIEGDNAGQVVPFDASILPYRDDLLAGKPIPPIISDDSYGYLLTIYKPLYDSTGKCQCYVAVDYSLDFLTEYTRTFIIKLLMLFIGCFVFIFAIGIVFVENNIILPVNTMAYCARNFSYDSASGREKYIELMKNLKIQTGDEIENLYRALIRTTENVLSYLEHLQRARNQVSDMKIKFTAMDEIAHKDSLTGVKNKTAYAESIALLDKKISAGDANFCIVMVDVNFLKRINDNYGHECGNNYLINACRLTCAVFGTENVYRIGGDEFVVIIEGEKVSLCKYFLAQFNFEMARKNNNDALQPWEKVSAAVGAAVYEAGKDKSADDVFKRADAEMYANKLAMKAARTA